MILRKLTAAMILMGTAGMANADPIIFVDPTSPPMPIVHPLEQTDWFHVDTVAQFNPANYGGAPLESVHIEDVLGSLHSDGGAVTCFIPDGSGNCTGHVDADVTITITGPDAIVTTVSLAFPQFNYSLTGQGSSSAIPGGDLVALSTPPSFWFCTVAQTGCLSVNPAVVALFQGTGTVSFTVIADGTVSTQNDTGTAGANYPLSADAQYGVRYDYEPIPPTQAPEPASLALMGLGLAGLGVWRRRKA